MPDAYSCFSQQGQLRLHPQGLGSTGSRQPSLQGWYFDCETAMGPMPNPTPDEPSEQ